MRHDVTCETQAWVCMAQIVPERNVFFGVLHNSYFMMRAKTMNDCNDDSLLEPHAKPSTLYMACDCGDLAHVKEILMAYPDSTCMNLVNKPGRHGRRPLHVAARKGYKDICELLLAHGADLELPTIHGCTALYFSVLSAEVEMVEMLADGYCANVNTSDIGNLSPLHLACEKGYAPMVKCLLLLGADYTALDIRHRSPLDWAIEKGHKDCIALISPDDPVLFSLPHDSEESEDDHTLSSSTVKKMQIALATRNEGVGTLKYPFTIENNVVPEPPYKIDIYDVH